MSLGDHMLPQRLDKGRLADAGDARNADPHRPSGIRQQGGQQRVGVAPMCGFDGLD